MNEKKPNEESTPKTFRDAQEDYRRLKNMAYKLNLNQLMNPLLKLPRNLPCPCKSGKKFKKCHLNKLPITVNVKEASHINKCMAEFLFKGIPIEFIEEKPKTIVREFAVKSDENGNIDMSKATEITEQPLEEDSRA